MQNEDFKFDPDALAEVRDMMEQSEGEQPKEQLNDSNRDDEQPIVQINIQNQTNETQQDSELGKFKNPQELLKAYRELEKEFTRRSQRLKELENASKPYEGEEEWRQATDKFFQKTPSARALARDIAGEIASDPTLKQSRDCFDKALLRVLARSYKTPEQLMDDGQFLKKYVLGSEKVKKAVIEAYLKDLDGAVPPLTLPGGGQSPAAPSKKPRTVREAGKMLLSENK